jgi:hypothetical protein
MFTGETETAWLSLIPPFYFIVQRSDPQITCWESLLFYCTTGNWFLLRHKKRFRGRFPLYPDKTKEIV